MNAINLIIKTIYSFSKINANGQPFAEFWFIFPRINHTLPDMPSLLLSA